VPAAVSLYRKAFARIAKQTPSAIASTGAVTMPTISARGSVNCPLHERHRARLAWIRSYRSIPRRSALVSTNFFNSRKGHAGLSAQYGVVRSNVPFLAESVRFPTRIGRNCRNYCTKEWFAASSGMVVAGHNEKAGVSS